MFIMYPLPIYFDSHLWESSDAFFLTPQEGGSGTFIDDGNKNWWEPFTKYGVNSVAKRGQYVFYSLKDGNEDDPFFNYVGFDPTTADSYGNPVWDFNVGKNSWIKGRCLHDFDCINTISPGYTQRDSNFSITISPKKMGRSDDIVNKALSTGAVPYLVLHGVKAGKIVVTNYNEENAVVGTPIEVTQTEKTPWLPASSGSRRICYYAKSSVIPDVPYVLKDTVYIPLNFTFLGDVVHHTVISFEKKDGNGNTYAIIGLRSCFICAPFRIGITQAEGFSVGAIDYSRISYDDWGRMSLVRGKQAKTMKVDVFLGGHNLNKQFKQKKEFALKLIEACRATPAGFIAANSVHSSTFSSSLPYIHGLVKSASLTETGTNNAVLSLQIEGMPTDYNP